MFKKYLPLIIALLIVGTPVFALSIFTVFQGGTGRSSLTASQLLYGNGLGQVGSVATTTVSCSGSASCDAFTVIGSSPITISATGGSGGSAYEIATTSTISVSGLSYFTKTAGLTTLGSVATSTLTTSAPLTGSFTQVGTGGVLGCTTASSGVAGCLSNTAFDTFNNKLGSYDAWTHPVAGNSATTSSISIFSLLNPSFFIATSSTETEYTNMFSVQATSSVLRQTSSVGKFLQDVGTRVGVGISHYYGFPDLLDHFVVRGRINTEGWMNNNCDIPVGMPAISADGIAGCGGYYFAEDGTATLTALTTTGYTYGQLATTIAGDGAGVWLNNVGTGFLTAATSTPVLEVNARIATVQNATTTNFFIGFTNVNTTSTAIDTLPTNGCFFTASSTEANWKAVCRTALNAGVYQDTGVASSTVITGTGGFRRFRVEMDNAQARFFIQQPNGNMVMTNVITSSIPTVNLNAGIHYARATGVAAVNFDFFRLRTWWRDFLPNY